MAKTAEELVEALSKKWKFKKFEKWLHLQNSLGLDPEDFWSVIPDTLSGKQKQKVAHAIFDCVPTHMCIISELELMEYLKDFYRNTSFKRTVKDVYDLVEVTKDFKWIAEIYAKAFSDGGNFTPEDYYEAKEDLNSLLLDPACADYPGRDEVAELR